MSRLSGKTCFVTGAGQGIGRSIAERFLAEGAAVIATDRDPGRLADLAGSPRVEAFGLDVLDDAAVAAAASRLDRVDVVVNCAGYVAVGPLHACSDDDFNLSLSLNVRAAWKVIQGFLPHLRQRRSGSIINIASVASTVMAVPDRFAYSVSKAALVGLTLSVARDYAGDGIRCNAISPGTVETPSLADRMAASGDAAAARKSFVARQLMGRLGRPEEIASVAALLASDEATFMTGANIVIDGGMSL